jgi:hypothetical protein
VLVVVLLAMNTALQFGDVILYGILTPLFLLALYSSRRNYSNSYLFKK